MPSKQLTCEACCGSGETDAEGLAPVSQKCGECGGAGWVPDPDDIVPMPGEHNDRAPATEDVDIEEHCEWLESDEYAEVVTLSRSRATRIAAALRAEHERAREYRREWESACERERAAHHLREEADERARKAEEALGQATALVRRLQEAVEDESVSNWYADTKASMDAADAFLAARAALPTEGTDA